MIKIELVKRKRPKNRMKALQTPCQVEAPASDRQVKSTRNGYEDEGPNSKSDRSNYHADRRPQ